MDKMLGALELLLIRLDVSFLELSSVGPAILRHYRERLGLLLDQGGDLALPDQEVDKMVTESIIRPTWMGGSRSR